MSIKPFKQFGYADTYADLATITAEEGQLIMLLDTKTSFIMTSGAWQPFARTAVKPSSVAINAMSTGATLIYTLETSPLNFVPVDVVLTMASLTGTITTQPVITVGTNATTYNNVATGSMLSTLLSTLSIGTGAPNKASYSPKLTGGTMIYANVTTAAIGPTALTYNVDLVGFYKA